MADNTLRFRAVLDDKVSKGLDRIGKGFDKIGGKGASASFFGNVGAKAVAKGFDLIGDATRLAFDQMGQAIDASSALSETMNKSAVIFGDSAKTIDMWGDTAAENFGQSKREALDAASTFAGLFQTVGTELDVAADQSKKLTQLGSDLASFFDTDVSSALEALRSGLAGEAEPMRRFNVFLSETAVKAKAAALGLKPVHGELSEGQKVAARYAIILDQTGKAQGDFVRTSDSLANAQRKANAVLEDLRAELGEELVPIQLQATKGQIDLIRAMSDTDRTVREAQLGLHDLGSNILDTATFWDQYTESNKAALFRVHEWIDSAEGAGEANRELNRSLVGVDGSFKGLGKAATDAADDVQTAFEEIIAAEDKMASDLESAGSKAAAAIFDPILLKAEATALALEAKRLRGARDAAKHGSAERAEYQHTLDEVNKKTIEVLAELAATGDEEAKATLEAFVATEKASGRLSKAQIAHLDNLLAKLGIVFAKAKSFGTLNFPMPNTGRAGSARQHGGPVWPGGSFLVGERGPEVFTPSGAGNIIPNHALSSMPAPVIQFFSLTAPSPNQGQEIARKVGPELMRWMRNQGFR